MFPFPRDPLQNDLLQPGGPVSFIEAHKIVGNAVKEISQERDGQEEGDQDDDMPGIVPGAPFGNYSRISGRIIINKKHHDRSREGGKPATEYITAAEHSSKLFQYRIKHGGMDNLTYKMTALRAFGPVVIPDNVLGKKILLALFAK
jgi:hypothetical protein